MRSAGPPSALSHTTGLRRWDLPSPLGPVHLLTPESRRIRGTENLVVHRTTLPIQSCISPAWRRRCDDVGSWSRHIARPEPPGPSVGVPNAASHRTGAARCGHGLNRLRDRAELRDLLDLLDAGCQSELELWGYRHVFNIPGLRGAIRQRAVVVRGETFIASIWPTKPRRLPSNSMGVAYRRGTGTVGARHCARPRDRDARLADRSTLASAADN